MNKIQYINVGGVPFSINEDAFAKLDNYMSQLNRHFSNSEGHKEIMEDIEFRIAELFQQYLQNQQILNLQHVEKLIQTMGTAETLSDGQGFDGGKSYPDEEESWEYTTGKRLFRDPLDKKISGVCSGIAHYFGIDDPIWVRLAFVLAGFAGFGILLYIILVFLLPVAMTSADRLAMKGKPVNIHNIADKVEEEFSNMTDRFDEWREKRRQRRQRRWRR
jgi:phage shock protein PspC (stress-responsive transcriptional regulator)